MPEYDVILRNTSEHKYQTQFIDSTYKRIAVKAGRRGGKTVGIAKRAIKRFLKGRRQLYGTPTSEQLKAFWDEVCKALEQPIAAGVYKKNESEHTIELPGTKQRIKAKTCWNADTLRGDYADDLYLDEFQLMAEDAWEDVGKPMLADHNGDAVLIFTPPSLKSSGISKARDPRHASKLFKTALTDTTGLWQAIHFTSWDNPYISHAGLEIIAKDMSLDSYRREIMAEDDDIEASWLVHSKFNESLCKIKRFDIPKNWDVYSGHDFGCVDEETEILTKRGWKRHNQVIEGDETLTFNLGTGYSEWQPIEKMNRYTGKVEMRLINQRGHSSLTTTNHRWPVIKRSGKMLFGTTKTLKDRDTVACGAQCSSLPETPKYSDSFVELIAWFWTEGQIDAGGVSIWQNEGEKAEQIRRCLTTEYGKPLTQTRNGRERARAGWVERPQRDSYSPRSGLPTGNKLCHFAINLNGAQRIIEVAPQKIVKSEFITVLTRWQLKLFIETSIKGDGWERYGRNKNKAGQSINQSDSSRLDPFQMACSLAGIRTYLSYGISRSYLSLYKRTNLDIGRSVQKRIFINGLVWCPTTPNGTWFARRKGTVYFTGNSANPAAVFISRVKLPLPSGAPNYMRLGDLVMFREYLPGAGYSMLRNIDSFKDLTRDYKVVCSRGGSFAGEKQLREGYTNAGWTILEPTLDKINAQIDRVIQLEESNKLYIFEDLYHILSEMANCMWKLTPDNKPTNEIKDEKNYHLLAALRYIASSPEFKAEVTSNEKIQVQVWK